MGTVPAMRGIGRWILTDRLIGRLEDVRLPAIAALHQANYATIANYLERELRYMDAGE